MEPLIAPVSKEELSSEVAALPEHCCLISRGGFDVFLVRAQDVSKVLVEIGRLRELTFRSVGEGTGKASDIDQYDAFYLNLFIWDRTHQNIVGGYRMGMGNESMDRTALEYFYINSLFEIHEGAIPVLEKSIELGRSYIIPEYQRGYLPFFLLWQGILQVLVNNENYQYLIGPVSISKYYSGLSKSLIVAFAKRYFYDAELAKFFTPKRPFQPELEPIDMDNMLNDINGAQLKDLETFINTIEPGHMKVPILLKQYTKLNAKFISFNLDPNFSDALDGLMIMDIKNIPGSILELLNEK